MKVYFVGCHSCGKSTLARYVAKAHGLPLLTEVVRTILSEMETTLPELHVDLDRVDEFQKTIFRRQLEGEAVMTSGFVSDRGFDNIAYAAANARVAPIIFQGPDFVQYMASMKAPDVVIFFVRPHPELLKEDGVRTHVSMDEACKIDGMIQLLLELYHVPYSPISCLSMRDRVRQVDHVMSFAKKANPS